MYVCGNFVVFQGEVELQDQVEGLEWIASNTDYIDLTSFVPIALDSRRPVGLQRRSIRSKKTTHRELRRAVSSESQFKASLLDCSDSRTSFMEG